MTAIAGFITNNPEHDGETIMASMLKRMEYPNSAASFIRLGTAVFGQVHHNNEDCLSLHTDNYLAVCRGDVLNHQNMSTFNRDCAPKETSQAQNLLDLFVTKGIDGFSTLNGTFSLSIYNKLEQKLHLVRDRYGELTLFYAQGKDWFAFASEIKALLELVPAQLNHDAISYKAFEFCIKEQTLFRNIFSLEPGMELTLYANGTIHTSTWWNIWDNLVEIPSTQEKAINHLIGLLEDSAALRLHGLNNFGCMLSGGIDSSLVASLTKPASLYHVHYDFDDFNELEYAQYMAKYLKNELCIIKPCKADFLRENDTIIRILDTPCTWTSFTLWMLLKKVREDNIDVLFTGDGADELFGGYHRYHLLYHDEQIHSIKAMQQYSYLIEKYYGSRVERYARLINRHNNIYDIKVNTYLNELLSFYDEVSNGDLLNFMTLTDFYSSAQIFFHMSDRIFSYNSLLSRSLFMDYNVVQFAFSLNSQYKINECVTKWILRKAAEKYIPKKILRRTDKRGFSAPVNKWFKWTEKGQYNREGYKNKIFSDWKRIFKVEN